MLPTLGRVASRRLLNVVFRPRGLPNNSNIPASARTFAVSRWVRNPAEKKTTTTTTKVTTTKKKKPVAAKTPKAAATDKKTKKAAKPKKKAAAKAKPKPKKKPAKKELTPEQEQRAKLRQLRATALKKPARKPENIWTVFVSQNLTTGASATEQVGQLRSAFQNLSSSERHTLEETAKANRRANETALKTWLESHDPEVIYVANVARRAIARLTKSKASTLHDTRIPKRPTSAYSYYLVKRMETRPNDLSINQFWGECSQEWKSLSDAEKKPYHDMHEADKQTLGVEHKHFMEKVAKLRSESPEA